MLVPSSSTSRASTSSPWMRPASSEGQRGLLAAARARHGGRGPGRVAAHHGLDAARAQEARALGQEHQMAVGAAHVLDPRARHAEQVDADPHEGLGDDLEPRMRQQAVDVGHAPVGRVLHRQHGEARGTRAHGLDGVLEGRAGQGVEVGPRREAGLVAVGARLALERDPARACALTGVARPPGRALRRAALCPVPPRHAAPACPPDVRPRRLHLAGWRRKAIDARARHARRCAPRARHTDARLRRDMQMRARQARRQHGRTQ